MLRPSYLFVMLVALAAALAACGGQAGPAGPPIPPENAPSGQGDPALDGTEWALESIRGRPIRRSGITLRFSEGRISGQAGCNRYGGVPYAGSEGRLAWNHDTLKTAKYCLPRRIMDLEDAYNSALVDAERYRKTDERLELLNAEGETILTFTRPKGALP